jgi:hypothetical protein
MSEQTANELDWLAYGLADNGNQQAADALYTAALELRSLRAAVGRLERIEAAAREIAEMRNDDTYKMYNVPARMVDALAAALAADGERGAG